MGSPFAPYNVGWDHLYESIQLGAQLELDHQRWPFYSPGPLSMWFLLIYYTRLSFLTTWLLTPKTEFSRKENAEADISLKDWAQKPQNITSTTFYWSEHVTRPPQLQKGERDSTS